MTALVETVYMRTRTLDAGTVFETRQIEYVIELDVLVVQQGEKAKVDKRFYVHSFKRDDSALKPGATPPPGASGHREIPNKEGLYAKLANCRPIAAIATIQRRINRSLKGTHFGRMLHNITPDAYNMVPHESRREGKLRQEVASQVLAAENYPSDPATDAMARYLRNDQMPDGRWRLIANRPPLGSSDFEVTAISMRALQAYSPKALPAYYEKAVWRAADWLRSNKPKTTADRVGQLLGLAWAGDSTESLKKLAADLLAEQRADGGWSQRPTMASDAFATGQALTALHLSGTVAASDQPYQRGVKYLLSTQL